MNILKLIILLGLSMICLGGSASAQTAIGTTNAAAITGVSGFSGKEVNRPTGPGSAFSQSERGAKFEVGVANGSLPTQDRYNTGFSVRPGGTPQPATGPVTTSVPGTNSVGTFGGGQTIVTNPGNSITVAPPGTTTIVVGQTGETNAVTPGTSGQTGGTVPGGVFPSTTATVASATSAIPGTQSIGVFASGQTIVTNPGNPVTVAPPGMTSTVVGPSGETSAVTPGTNVLSSQGTIAPGTFGSNTTTPSGSTTPAPTGSAFAGLSPGAFGAAVSGTFGGNASAAGSFGPNVGRR